MNNDVTSLHGLTWQTCLRKLVFCQRNAPLPGPANAAWEYYQAENAYQFLLEIICGLHSPLLGETEVMGQFRAFCASARFPANRWGQFLKQLTGDLLRDAKRIRHEHLQQLGARSYGSLASRLLQDTSVIAVLGAGQLAQEMLPALLETADVKMYARTPQRVTHLAQPHLSLHALTETSNEWAAHAVGLVVAAPLSANEIHQWIAQQKASFMRVLDLRGEAAHDPLSLPCEVIDLAAFFASLQSEKQKAEHRAAAARQAIAERARRQLQQVVCRPWGWEDLCA